GADLDEIDEAVLGFLEHGPPDFHHDLMDGLVGQGIYALARLPREAGARMLELIAARLAANASRVGDGSTWRSPPQAPGAAPELFPEGHIDLGCARGVPGVIALLGAMVARGVAVDVARPLRDGAVAWLLAQRLPPGAGGVFPSVIAPGYPLAANRPGW